MSKKRVDAVCPCGHKGKSSQPEYYRCGYCYYMTIADSDEAKIVKLAAKIKKLRGEVSRCRDKAKQFKSRHADVGSVEDKWKCPKKHNLFNACPKCGGKAKLVLKRITPLEVKP